MKSFRLLLFVLAILHTHVSADSSNSSNDSSGTNDNVRLTPEDFRVKGLEEFEPAYAQFDGDMFAGLLPMDNSRGATGELMFWLFAPHEPAVTDSLAVWFNGGPGCSSINGGVFFEHSPVTVTLHPAGFCCGDAHDPLQYNEFAWTKATHMLYIEQPVGVGFSHGGPKPVNETEVAQDFFAFFQNWLRVFEDYQSKTVWITGESYAGYYVPSIAHYIHQQNTQLFEQPDNDVDNDIIPIDLGGMVLGNAWVDARIQGPATIDYAYWHGIIDQTTRENLHDIAGHCLAHPGQREPAPFHAFTTPDDCSIMEGVLQAAGKGLLPNFINGPNLYDVTTWDNYEVIQDGDTTINNFMNIPGVKKALNAPADLVWTGCMKGAGRRRHLESKLLMHDQPISTLPYIAELLDAGKRVLVYNGDRDLSTCVQGTEMLLDSMKWTGADDWQDAKRGLWVVDDYPAGYSKSLLGLDFVVVYNSGHLVPFNRPRNALDLFTRFLENKTFAAYDLPSFDYGFKTPMPSHKHRRRHHSRAHHEVDSRAQAHDHASPGFGLVAVLLTAIVSFFGGYVASKKFKRAAIRAGYNSLPEPDEKTLVMQ